jgi:CTP-dependent riboflavin kinase
VKRRVWSPDRLDVAIVAELVTLGGERGCVIERADLACRLEISSERLDRRMRWLATFGYVMRTRTNRGSRYLVVKVPQAGDEHDVQRHLDRTGGGRGR